ncbi:E3 ubiquitin-protein ligase RING1-like [Phoenix dactylifera]|uniref:E3 ubiquitin-protein ligase RING1-like n=1 Tax=Phoenix dactylifera TaxID=42345 RepID=A0A8B9AZ02_PHODC|nr:E3 ubiquitin-protein ligase RING1-like [Phoenix dactylifera]
MALKVLLKETRRTFLCFEDGYKILKTVTEVPTTEKLEAFSLDGFLSLELSSKAVASVLRGPFSDDWKERYFEGVISYLAHAHAKDAVASPLDTVALKAEFEVMTDILEPSEKCMVCLAEFQPSEVVERKPCGHTYHEVCMKYYIKHNIDCPTCYYDDPASSSKSNFAPWEYTSKVSRDFLDTDDVETEEESSEEPTEMC